MDVWLMQTVQSTKENGNKIIGTGRANTIMNLWPRKEPGSTVSKMVIFCSKIEKDHLSM